MEKIKESLKNLFVENYGVMPTIRPIPGGGSSRRYFRLSSENFTVIGTWCDEIRENQTFIRLNQILEKAGVKVPHIFGVSKDSTTYLIQDLGDKMLLDCFRDENDDTKMKMARKALSELVDIQTLPENIWKNDVGHLPFSERLVRWDLNYFKYDYLKPDGVIFDENLLEDDFDLLTRHLTQPPIFTGLMYRDFQSRNIMVFDGNFWFIDFQGARKGPLTYDAASFIWQAKAPFTYEERKVLGDFYCEILAERIKVNKPEVERQLKNMIVFRTLQVLGAYGFRGLIERKPHFLESIPAAVSNLNQLRIWGWISDYPEIERISERLIEKRQLLQDEKNVGLLLEVFSFSYKGGYPVNTTGNGGGFMFDCRGIHNPGRYQEYKDLTGKDKEVIEFLENNSNAKEFVRQSFEVVRPTVDTYLKRGFTSLQTGFGCTGGRHRSVFCAENFAQIIKEHYPDIKVKIIHREQEESRIL